jgi:hypothetical protein
MPFAGEPFAGAPFAGEPFAGAPFAGQVVGSLREVLGPAGLILWLITPLGGYTKHELDAIREGVIPEGARYDRPDPEGDEGAGRQPPDAPTEGVERQQGAQGHPEDGDGHPDGG